jgi:hypothetical protein
MTVRALVPQDDDTPSPAVDLVMLAGADLDSDVFVQPKESARRALAHAGVWWVTVPKEAQADAALELRRGAGRRDAIGNVGLSLERADFQALMERRGLLLDDERIPIAHDIRQYFDGPRLRRLARSMLYLRQPAALQAARSDLALLDRLLAGGAAGAPNDLRIGARLYQEWRRQPAAGRFGVVRVIDPERVTIAE